MFLIRPLRFLAQSLMIDATPRQLAWGFSLGMVIGLVPKGNLTAILLMALLGSLRVNLAAGALGIFIFTWVGMLLDPISHRLGFFLLTRESLAPLWIALYDTNLVPWTAFNNTVVLGSTLIGLILLYPVYSQLRPLLEKIPPEWADKARKFKIVQLLRGGELAEKLA